MNIEKKSPKPNFLPIAPWPLNSLNDICKAFKRSRRTIIGWRENGAPIATQGTGARQRYTSEYNLLLSWILVYENDQNKMANHLASNDNISPTQATLQ